MEEANTASCAPVSERAALLLIVIESVVAVPVSVIVKVLRPKTPSVSVLSARPKPRVNAPAGPVIATATAPDIASLATPRRFRVVAVALMFAGTNEAAM